MKATVRTASGAVIEVDGSLAEIAMLITHVGPASASGQAVVVRRGPGRPPKFAQMPTEARKQSAPSPARLRAMKVQGAYMGVLRALPEKEKSQVKELAKAKGVAAALGLAKKLRAATEKRTAA